MIKGMFSGVLAVLSLVGMFAVNGAQAEIFSCKDPVTGKTTFSDKACPDHSTGEHVTVGGPGGSNSSQSSTTSSRSDNRSSAGPVSEKYTHQARASEKTRADRAATNLERKVD